MLNYLLVADVLKQIICNIKVRRAPTRNDNIDFKPIVTRISKIKSLSVVVADKAYDSEDNHVPCNRDTTWIEYHACKI